MIQVLWRPDRLPDVGPSIYGPARCWRFVGESGSGKTTLLNCISTRLAPTAGYVGYRHARRADARPVPPERGRTAVPDAHRLGLRAPEPGATGCACRSRAGANVGERLMAIGERHYGNIREHGGRTGSGASRSATGPYRRPAAVLLRRHAAAPADRPQPGHRSAPDVFMDEPTGGLDVSVQARLLDLLRGLVNDLGLWPSSWSRTIWRSRACCRTG